MIPSITCPFAIKKEPMTFKLVMTVLKDTEKSGIVSLVSLK